MNVTPGPKPKLPEIAEKQGNPGHRPIVKAPSDGSASEIGAPPVDATVPDWLDEGGRAIWLAYMPRLKTMGYMKDTDRLAFARLCDHTARWMRLRLKVNDRGESYTTESRHGKMERINPDFAAMLRLEEKMVQLEDRFGLTPSARQQILARLADPSDLPLAIPSHDAAPQSTASPVGMLAPNRITPPTSGGLN